MSGNAVATRATDERDLLALHLLSRGVNRGTIARRTGMSRAYIGAVRHRVLQADLAESGEPEDLIRSFY